MVGACCTHRREEKYMQVFGRGEPEGCITLGAPEC